LEAVYFFPSHVRQLVLLHGNLESHAHGAAAATAGGAERYARISTALTPFAVVRPPRTRAFRAASPLAHVARFIRVLAEISFFLFSQTELLEPTRDDEATEDNSRGDSLVDVPLRVTDIDTRTRLQVTPAVMGAPSRRREVHASGAR